jgi:general nucleoside transport system ATP-binding protein
MRTVAGDALLEMRGIVKNYGPIKANDGIDLTVGAGSVLGLLGENGSGKSTLMKILFGMVPKDSGSIVFKGRALAGHSPRVARSLGIGMIHQHFMLAEAMTALENVQLAAAASADQVRRISANYGLDVDPGAVVGHLALGERQRVEIMKALLAGAELLILDEPTSNLSAPEVERLAAVIRRLRDEGKAVIFISHKLIEVMALCSRFVVLRNGSVVGAGEISGTGQDRLANMMVGSEMGKPYQRFAVPAGEDRLELDDLSVPGGPDAVELDAISLQVRAGDVLAVAGVDGNGQRELADTIAGLRRPSRGRLVIDGIDETHASVARRMAAGIAYIPADRATTSLVPAMSIAENLILRDVRLRPFSRCSWLNRSAIQAHARRAVAQFDIKTTSVRSTVAQLSGGNRQKIVVARELGRSPKILVAQQATWGLDPRATQFVLDEVLRLRDAGAAILYISSELDEVLRIGDRIGVMFRGRMSRPVRRMDADLEQIGLMMGGIGL